ncbi:hypothetical protein LCGC14_1918940 [marine sediment metagenome]|uniref:Uncharacterized protein n=1 Tax=marine sediment metagenome TaxID=412755 RepID=A0A0F9I5D4_9ZZZZ
MRKFTVIGLHPDADWSHGMREASFVEWIEAEDSAAAGHRVQEALSSKQDADPDDYLVIAVFEGELHDIYELES